MKNKAEYLLSRILKGYTFTLFAMVIIGLFVWLIYLFPYFFLWLTVVVLFSIPAFGIGRIFLGE